MKVLLISLLCLVQIHLNSQSVQVECGIGLTYFDLTESEAIPTPSVAFGINYEYDFVEFLTASAGIRFVQKGHAEESSVGDLGIKLSYIELPLFLRGNIPLNDKILKPELGYYFASGFGGQATIDEEPIDTFTFGEAGFNTKDKGVIFGVGLGLKSASIYLRYYKGTEKIHSDPAYEYKNNLISISITANLRDLKRTKK